MKTSEPGSTEMSFTKRKLLLWIKAPIANFSWIKLCKTRVEEAEAFVFPIEDIFQKFKNTEIEFESWNVTNTPTYTWTIQSQNSNPPSTPKLGNLRAYSHS